MSTVTNADRMDWADGLDVPTVESNPDADVLLWVGCAGAFDRRNQKVTRALVKQILHDPIAALRERGDRDIYVDAVRTLFRLDQPAPVEDA